jgi:hypothetical protein
VVDILEWQIAVPGTPARRSPPGMWSFDQGGGEAPKAPRREAQSLSSTSSFSSFMTAPFTSIHSGGLETLRRSVAAKWHLLAPNGKIQGSVADAGPFTIPSLQPPST